MQDLVKLARKQKYDDLELAWMEELEQNAPPTDDMLLAGKALIEQNNHELAENLLWYLVSTLREHDGASNALPVAKQACSILKKGQMIREVACLTYKETHKDEPWRHPLLELTLENEKIPLPDAIDLLSHLESMPPGTYVRVDPGARIGMVKKISDKGKITIELDDDEQNIAIGDLDRVTMLPPDDFRALAIFEKDRLKRLSIDAPEELITLALKTLGGRAPLIRIKRHLIRVIGKNNWSSWWSNARKKLEKSSRIGVTSGTNPDLFLRAEPRSRNEQLKDSFKKAHSIDRLKMALQAMKENVRDPDYVSFLQKELARLRDNNRESDRPLALTSEAILQVLQKTEGEEAKRPDWAEVEDFIEWLATFQTEKTLSEFAISTIQKWNPDKWPNIYARALPLMPLAICQKLGSELEKKGYTNLLREATNQILQSPESHHGALVWLWKQIDPERDDHFVDNSMGLTILRQLITSTRSIARESHHQQEHKKTLKQIDNALTGKGEEKIDRILEHASDEELESLVRIVERNNTLNKHTRRCIERCIRAARPELFRRDVPAWEQPVIYTTQSGLDKRRKQYEYIVDQRMPKVIKEIGQAAEFGDLSENAEYTAALEERSRLSEKAAEIKEELARARVIPHDMPTTTMVNIGCTVEAKNDETGETRTFTFLGPWDSDPKAGIYSYLSPIGLKFMGKKQGDSVELNNDKKSRWKIVNIEKTRKTSR
jgi:transcription elongation factor GreA